MKHPSLKKLSLLFLVTAALATPMLGACGKKGGGEKAGEKVDEAIEDTKDAFDKDGPVEDAGEKVDDAVD